MSNLFEALASVVDETDVEAMFADDYPFIADADVDDMLAWNEVYHDA